MPIQFSVMNLRLRHWCRRAAGHPGDSLTSHRVRRAARSGVLGALFYLTAIFAVPGGDALGQSTYDGSLYSRFGMGELQSFSTSQSAAMGGAGAAMHSLTYVNFSNPGTWADQVLTRVAAGATFQNIRISDAARNESRLASGFLNAVQFSLPLQERKLGLAFGFVPFSRVSYRVVEQGTTHSPVPDTARYTVVFDGSGGLQELVGGVGYRLNRNLSAGVSVSGIFGIVENGRKTSFFDAAVDPRFVETDVATSTQLSGITATFGLLFTDTDLLRQNDYFTIGGAFTLPTTLTGERALTLRQGTRRDTLGTTVSGTVEIPWRVVGGAAYHPSNRWIFALAGRFEPWTQFRSELSFPGVAPGSSELLSDRVFVGTGAEFLPAGSDLLAPFLSRVAYRLGVYFDRSYISPSSDVRIQTMALTGGLGLPTMMTGTRLDLNLEVGTRGTTDHNLVRDLFYRVSLSVNVGERWFQRTQLR